MILGGIPRTARRDGTRDERGDGRTQDDANYSHDSSRAPAYYSARINPRAWARRERERGGAMDGGPRAAGRAIEREAN